MSLPDFDYSLESIAGIGQSARLTSARVLAAAGCDLVASIGTLFAGAARTRSSLPGKDAIVISGSGARTLGLVESLRDEAGIAVIGSDTALYRAITAALELDYEGLIRP